ncbi:unnamed protein product [Phaedon cochleariae]|uniref:Hflx-type G domain-containing protein n=1 Tax=Phaedon cochleariae TaxID=80249 RepID=A0A9P0DPJ9_PHACE|nr:unnamed protein product [Phaedon cochleariae]
MSVLKNATFIRGSCIRTIKFSTSVFCKSKDFEVSDHYIDEVLTSESVYNDVAYNYLTVGDSHNCLIIQPYVKWGPRKLSISPQEQLEEAVSLIKTLPSWTVQDTISVPLETLTKKSLFKSGSMEKLSRIIQKNPSISAVFINASSLKKVTNIILQENFRLPILDRYKIVMQILKLHATSKHAKLQVALAELYFVQRKAQLDNLFTSSDSETMKLMFQSREQKLKKAIQELRNQRMLLRSKRKKLDYPLVAVVGYTNAGKTCLIKALTGDETLQPKNQLFATLDVTVHSGILPSGMEVLYVDTVGFLSDIPTNLIECFVATLEDAVFADVILHVEDLSSSCFKYKRNHVLTTLNELSSQSGHCNIMDKVISVGNKIDLAEIVEESDLVTVSAKNGIGLNNLRSHLEKAILKFTARQILTVKIPNGGDEIRWLYKNSTVVSEIPSEDNQQLIKAKIIITDSNLRKFRHNFIGNVRKS